MSVRRPWLLAAAAVLCLTVPVSPTFADAGAGEPKGSSQAEPGEHDHDGKPGDRGHGEDETDVDGDGLTPVQRAKLAAFQRAIEDRNQAAVSFAQAREAANIAAGIAVRASQRATEANQDAAAAELAAAVADLEAARMRALVEGFAHQMASGHEAGNQVLLSLVISGKSPSEVLRIAESSERTAATITETLRSLVELTQEAERARVRARLAQENAVAEGNRADRKARAAARMLADAHTRFSSSQRTLTQLISTDVVVSEAAAVGDIPGCADAAQAGVFPNGMLPAEVLCEPEMAPGHRMRSDAARAFDAMARAYATQLGAPLCITDSYRSLAAQVALKVRKPYLAATPGTSNHGWGVAIDMCGGVENFGTPEHDWMRTNAALFGWMHPSWAQESGSKPEPWHWEYSPELALHMQGLLGEATKGAKSKKKQGVSASVAGVDVAVELPDVTVSVP